MRLWLSNNLLITGSTRGWMLGCINSGAPVTICQPGQNRTYGRTTRPCSFLTDCVRHMPCAFHFAMFRSQVSGSLTGA